MGWKGNVAEISITTDAVDGAASFRIGANEYFVPLAGAVDTEVEMEKLMGELKHAKGFSNGVQKKLGNERFVANAPVQVVDLKKKADALTKVEILERGIAALKDEV